MNVTPSGNRRHMEAQQYLSDEGISSALENLILKVAATLDLEQDQPGIGTDIKGTPAAAPETRMENPAPKEPNVNDAMNQSNTLPQKQSPGSDSLEGKVSEIVRAVLDALKIDSSQWNVTNSSISGPDGLKSIKIEMQRVVGPQVQKQ